MGFPIFLVLTLHEPMYYFGIAMAISYGIGSLFSALGGVLADKYNKKKVAIIGNSLIPILSFTGVTNSGAGSIMIFSGGWWARNFRTPARRSLLSEITPDKNKSKVFGFLNALDIGGGLIAVFYVSVLLFLKISLSTIFLLTIIPIVISTLCLVFVKYKQKIKKSIQKLESNINRNIKLSLNETINKNTYFGILIATALFGFSTYSLGFPIITIASDSSKLIGVESYAFFLIFSALFGYLIGLKKVRDISNLALLGYVLAGFASLIIAISLILNLGIIVDFIGVIVLGLAAGTIETLEPTLISFLSKSGNAGKRMGFLTTFRSIGVFSANIAMGFLYFFKPSYSYIYGAAVAISAGLILLWLGRKFKTKF